MLKYGTGLSFRGIARRRRRFSEAPAGVELRSTACKARLFTALAAGVALGLVGMTATAWADTDNYQFVRSVAVQSNPITCTYSGGSTLHPLGGGPPFANPNVTTFSFDISWVAQARGEYLLAERSHGRPSNNTEGGMLADATSGDIMVINTDDPDAVPKYILPPRNDPFAGHRCDENGYFGGLGSRNEIEGPNGVFTVNDTEAWVGDGPSYFTPGQNNMASDYKNDPCDSSVRVFSLITRKQIDHINVHGCFRTDEGAFDPVDQIALWANPSDTDSVREIDPHARSVDHSPFLTLISTKPGSGHNILEQINFDGKHGTVAATGGIEQAVYSRQTGLFYIAVPGNDAHPDGYVTTVDPRPDSFGTVQNYALEEGTCDGGPAGAALGPNHELLLGCGTSSGPGELVVDITDLGNSTSGLTGPTVLNDGSTGCDEVAYDAGSGHFGGACFTAIPGDFNLLVNDARTYPLPKFDVNILHSGTFGAHSIAADSTNENFWMPMSGGHDCADLDCVGVYSGDDTDAQGD